MRKLKLQMHISLDGYAAGALMVKQTGYFIG